MRGTRGADAHWNGLQVQVGSLAVHDNVYGGWGHKFQVGAAVVKFSAPIVDLHACHHGVVRFAGVHAANSTSSPHFTDFLDLFANEDCVGARPRGSSQHRVLSDGRLKYRHVSRTDVDCLSLVQSVLSGNAQQRSPSAHPLRRSDTILHTRTFSTHEPAVLRFTTQL